MDAAPDSSDRHLPADQLASDRATEAERLAKAILSKAVRLQASYCFIEPGPYALCVGYATPRGQLLEPPLPWRSAPALMSRIKQMAGLSENLAGIQSGRFRCRIGGQSYGFSATFLPVQQGEVLGIEIKTLPADRGKKPTKDNFLALKLAYGRLFQSDRKS
ncbi:MAG: hypothetical protein CVV27_00875 [Candidatus Melainabacteria bacterium HGW-Melainabacteria-1]|nr:MAG: hypothetical protein CVV27_00875 [Candidatus Melainabacteria bacterium HGW-Melainabacteria-1]